MSETEAVITLCKELHKIEKKNGIALSKTIKSKLDSTLQLIVYSREEMKAVSLHHVSCKVSNRGSNIRVI